MVPGTDGEVSWGLGRCRHRMVEGNVGLLIQKPVEQGIDLLYPGSVSAHK